MPQRFLRRHSPQLFPRPPAERPAGSRQYQFLHSPRPLTRQTLEYRRMFRIHRQHRHPMFLHQTRHQFTRHHQGLLVRQRNVFPRLHRLHRGPQPAVTDHRRQYQFHIRQRHHLRHGIRPRIYFYVRPLQCLPHLRIFALIGNDHAVRAELPRLLHEQCRIPAGSKHLHGKHPGMRLHHLQRLGTDGAGGPQYRYSPHTLIQSV